MQVDSTTTPPICKLNSYCLDNIFDFLGFKDQINFATINSIFHDAYLSHLYWHKKIVINDDVHEKDLPKLLKFCQENVKELKSVVANCTNFGKKNDFLTSLKQYYLTLLELKLRRLSSIEPSALDKMLTGSSLKVLQLSGCNLTDLHCRCLQNCKNLEVLDLSENYAITGKFLNNFENLLELNLNYCGQIDAVDFATLIKVSCNLERVHIVYCIDIDRTTLMQLKNIKAVTVSDTFIFRGIDILLQLPKLEHVEVYGTEIVRELFSCTRLHILKIVNNKRDRCYMNFDEICKMHALTHLTIINCESLDDKCILNIANLGNLTYLNVTGCRRFSLSTLLEVIVTLKNLTELDISFCGLSKASVIHDWSMALGCHDSKRKIIVYNTTFNEHLKVKFDKLSLIYKNINIITRLASHEEENLWTTEFEQYLRCNKIRNILLNLAMNLKM